MRKAAFILAAMLTAVPAHAFAQGPTVAEFLTRVRAVIEMGEAAAGTPAMQQVRSDVAAAGQAIRARQQAERSAGTPPTLCIPEQATADGDLITHLMAIPEAQRGMPLAEAFAGYVRRKFPCPAR